MTKDNFPSDNLRVTHGPPGTGKTTYLSEMAAKASSSFGAKAVLLASLTRAAAAEISSRNLPLPKDRIGTLHSHAYRAIGSPPIAEASGELLTSFEEATGFAVTRVETNGDDVEDETVADDASNPSIYEAYLRHRARCTERSTWSPTVLKFAAAWESFKAENGLIDFEDMISVAYTDTSSAPGDPHVIYIDEAQDHSASEFRLALKWAAAARGGAVLVGDTDQTIYEWRGADPAAFRGLDVPPERHRVLEQSYRVPRAVHAVARRLIRGCSSRDDVTYYPRDADGTVECLDESTFRHVPSLVRSIERIVDDTDETVMVIGSCGYMLRPLIIELRNRGVPFHNPFRRRRGDWNPLARHGIVADFLVPDVRGSTWTWAELTRWLGVVRSKCLQRRMKKIVADTAKTYPDAPIAADVAEGLDVLQSMVVDGGALPTGGVSDRLCWLVSSALASRKKGLEYPARVAAKRGPSAIVKKPRVIVGTIHSVKGAEADHVYVFPDISVRSLSSSQSDRGRDELTRLFYVAATRARQSLHVLRPALSGLSFNIL